MTDITPIHSPGGAGGADPTKDPKRTQPGQGPSFADVLAGTKGADAAKPAGQSTGPHAIPATPYIGSLDSPSSKPGSVAEAGENFLRLIENLQSQLTNAQVTLRDIAPLVRDIEVQREGLLETLSSLPKGDPGRNILEEMATLASSEVAKFNRGDYI